MEENNKREVIFADGMFFKLPHPNSPDFIKGKISFKVKEFIAFLQTHEKDNYVNVDMKKSKEGKLYFQLDTWIPKAKEGSEELGKGKEEPEINLKGF